MKLFKTLYARLALALCALFVLTGGMLVYMSTLTSERYSLEITQRINRDIALHAAEDMPLLVNGAVNEVALKELAHHVMFINPIVEVYLLDTEGRVLSHALPYETVVREQVDMQPLQAFMQGEQELPIFGDDPRSPTERKVFSVSPILEHGEPAAYLYTVLNGKALDSLRESLAESYNLRAGSLTIISSLVAALVVGILLFALLTRRLRTLILAVRHYRESGYERMDLPQPRQSGDEIDELGDAVLTMSERIDQQFDLQQELDRTRRDLIANVSHDLRTPIASMQGYLETVLVKDLTEQEQRDYLQTAYKNTRRLNDLIGQLFELSKLESSTVEPDWEEFPLMELVQDLVQDHELSARDRGITLTAHCTAEGSQVVADISLIHRVLENLLNNALRHTADNGQVDISVHSDDAGIRVEVSDNGEGIASHEIPHIFDRFYRPDTESQSSGHGLGLAIVKRIVELHRSRLDVRSTPEQGTTFSFWLPQTA